jgi:serine/threonine protein kinase
LALSRLQDYTLADVWRWVQQLATALTSLDSLGPERVVHGDIKTDNILVCPNGDLVLGDLGGAMWQGMRTGLRLGPWLPSTTAFVAPERRPELIRPHFGLSETKREELVNELLEKMGEGKLDVWSLGVVAYLLGLRKDPRGFDEDKDKMHEVDGVDARADANEWVQAQLQQVWQDGDTGQLRVLANVITGALREKPNGRLSASQILELMAPGGKP